MRPQIIATPGGEELIVLTRAAYEALRAQAVIVEVAPRPLRAVRIARGFSQMWLAEQAGIAQGFLSDIEAGNKQCRASTWSKIAAVLGVQVKEIV